MAEAVQCLYMRAVLHQLTKESASSDIRYCEMCQVFPSIKENIPRVRFDVTASRLNKTIQRRWDGAFNKADFLKRFCKAKWQKPVAGDKAIHP